MAAALADRDPGTGVVLVGHSGAGPLLPGIATTLARRVRALIYVDSVLPYPGRSWLDAAPAALAMVWSAEINSQDQVGVARGGEWLPSC